jgi:hypothetical protein
VTPPLERARIRGRELNKKSKLAEALAANEALSARIEELREVVRLLSREPEAGERAPARVRAPHGTTEKLDRSSLQEELDEARSRLAALEEVARRAEALEADLAATRTRLAEARWAAEAAERRAEQLAEDLRASGRKGPASSD